MFCGNTFYLRHRQPENYLIRTSRTAQLVGNHAIAQRKKITLDLSYRFFIHRLVRNVEGAEQLAFSLAGEEPTRYAGLRLLMNLLVVRKLADVEKAKGVASQWAEDGDAVARVARQIKEEIEWCF